MILYYYRLEVNVASAATREKELDGTRLGTVPLASCIILGLASNLGLIHCCQWQWKGNLFKNETKNEIWKSGSLFEFLVARILRPYHWDFSVLDSVFWRVFDIDSDSEAWKVPSPQCGEATQNNEMMIQSDFTGHGHRFLIPWLDQSEANEAWTRSISILVSHCDQRLFGYVYSIRVILMVTGHQKHLPSKEWLLSSTDMLLHITDLNSTLHQRQFRYNDQYLMCETIMKVRTSVHWQYPDKVTNSLPTPRMVHRGNSEQQNVFISPFRHPRRSSLGVRSTV